MNISIHIDAESSAAELVALANFSNELARTRGPRVPMLTAPVDPAELDEPENVAATTPEQPVKLGRARRRTKDELRVDAIVAENARVAAAEAEEQAQHAYDHARNQPSPEEQGAAVAPGEPGNDQPASTPPAASTEAATTTPATASPSDDGKEYTEAEVQDLAGKVARTIGPEVVKGKIAELGAARIAELTQEQRNGLGRFLVSKLP